MAAPPDLVPEQQLRESFLKHAARAQLHRLCDRRGRPAGEAGDLADALAAMGAPSTACGTIGSVALAVDGESILFEATFASGEAWRGAFMRTASLLPAVARLEVVRPSRGPLPQTTQTDGDHRVRSTVHYFFALVENPAREPEPFRELLAEPFSLHYTERPMTEFDTVRTWVTGRLASVVASEHDIHRIQTTRTAGDLSAAEVVMKSQALFPDGAGAISRNTQRWTLRDDPTERFPRITQILIDRDAVEFFGPAPDYEPRALPR